jgi:cell division protein FtsQ
VLLLALFASLGLAVWVYFFTGVLNVTVVEVRGNHQLDTGYIVQLSQVNASTHLLRMDKGEVVANLKRDPWIKSASVERHFPSRVVLEVEERVPVAQVASSEGYFLVDETGCLIAGCDAPRKGLLLLEGLPLEGLEPGRNLGCPEFELARVTISEMPEGLKERMSALRISPGKKIVLVAKEGFYVYLGEGEDLARKMEVALLIIEEVLRRYGAIEYIDVTVPENPVIKPR